ncbi:hypothetical protein DL96DRAFT_1707783 [Flagelloscypha sp. PMI_526]|nr:hypothetical protein DL96DRAFT_1707783 [Flagelloscypha sp. PMI_526]
MDQLQASFETIGLDDDAGIPQVSYEALNILRERYLLSFDALYDPFLCLSSELTNSGFLGNALSILRDEFGPGSSSYFPTHEDLWNSASLFHLAPRDPSLPWDQVQSIELLGSAHRSLSLIYFRLYGYWPPRKEVCDYAPSARGLAIRFKMPHILHELDTIGSRLDILKDVEVEEE